MTRDNILKIRERIALACARAKRSSGSVNIVAVTKGRPARQIAEAVACGLADIGENKVQEAVLKYKEFPSLRWHMVGHLQTNKAHDAVKIFGLIHSVDSLRLAAEIDKGAAKINKVQDVLIEVNTSGEASKFGVKPDEAPEVARKISELKNIKIKGLMTIAPVLDNPQEARPYFRMLRELRDKMNSVSAIGYRLSTLSMGMSGDFEVAIEEGADMVRLGRAIFEG